MMHSCSEWKMVIWSLCLIILSLCNSILVFGSHAKHLCRPDQRDALWEFKNEFHSNNKTKMWRNNTDCCSWDGISCDPKTGKVVELDLEESFLNGPLRSNSSLFRLQHLHSLHLAYNNISGILPDSIGNLKYLRALALNSCNFFGKIPSSLGNLSYLTDLDLSFNGFTGELPYSMGNLNRLTYLYFVDISANQIEGQVPEWLWRLPGLQHVNISQNFFSGFEGSVDVIQRSGELIMLDISSNTFQDPFPLLPNSTKFFLGSDNRFSGEIPRTICNLVALQALVLSNNNFNGSIPRCFKNFNTTLSVLHLQNNSFYGIFPEESISDHLRSFDVGHNQLSGKLPKSLINCTQLEFLNVEGNIINDTFPFWLRLLPNLQILVLRSNKFYGPISSPRDSLSFPKLRIFDISENHFTGVLPSDYFAVWTAMSSVVDIVHRMPYGRRLLNIVDSMPSTYAGRDSVNYHNSVTMIAKGLKMELVGSSFTIYKTIDISGNRFQGDVPESIGLLKELIVLNMSNNAFTGHIPPSLSNLTNLESLDLSQNRLSGKIPPQLGQLTFLERMNFSYNRLEGTIPQGTQFQSQDSSSFEENPGLCGVPLQETCSGKEGTTQQQVAEKEEEEEEEDQVLSWIAAAIGYVPGVVCGLTICHILTSYKRD